MKICVFVIVFVKYCKSVHCLHSLIPFMYNFLEKILKAIFMFAYACGIVSWVAGFDIK